MNVHQSHINVHQSNINLHLSNINEHQSNINEHQSNIYVHPSNMNVHQCSISVSAHIFEELGFVFDVSQEPVQHGYLELVIGHPAHVLPCQWHQMGEPVENET